MPGTPLGITLPTVGTTLGPQWASDLNTAIQTIIDDVEPQVRASEINIDADLEMNVNNLIEVEAVQYDSGTLVLSGALNARKTHFSGGEFFVVDGSGVSVRITSGGAIDVSTTGGWTGDYAADPATASYTAASNLFALLQDPGIPGELEVADIHLKEAISTTFSVDLASPAALASSYDFIFPTALPAGSNNCLAITTGGQVSAPTSPTLDGLTMSGTNPIDFGAADWNHTSKTMLVPGASGIQTGGAAWTSGEFWDLTAGGQIIYLPLFLPWTENVRITDFSVYVREDSTNVISAPLRAFNMTNGSVSTVQFASSGTTGADAIISPAPFIHDVLAAFSYHFFIDVAGAATARIYGATVTYERL